MKPAHNIVKLDQERGVVIGQLFDIIDRTNPDLLLVCIGRELVEVPSDLKEDLRRLLDKNVVVGCFNGKYRVTENSHLDASHELYWS
jgi:hypothetical protein